MPKVQVGMDDDPCYSMETDNNVWKFIDTSKPPKREFYHFYNKLKPKDFFRSSCIRDYFYHVQDYKKSSLSKEDKKYNMNGMILFDDVVRSITTSDVLNKEFDLTFYDKNSLSYYAIKMLNSMLKYYQTIFGIGILHILFLSNTDFSNENLNLDSNNSEFSFNSLLNSKSNGNTISSLVSNNCVYSEIDYILLIYATCLKCRLVYIRRYSDLLEVIDSRKEQVVDDSQNRCTDKKANILVLDTRIMEQSFYDRLYACLREDNKRITIDGQDYGIQCSLVVVLGTNRGNETLYKTTLPMKVEQRMPSSKPMENNYDIPINIYPVLKVKKPLIMTTESSVDIETFFNISVDPIMANAMQGNKTNIIFFKKWLNKALFNGFVYYVRQELDYYRDNKYKFEMYQKTQNPANISCYQDANLYFHFNGFNLIDSTRTIKIFISAVALFANHFKLCSLCIDDPNSSSILKTTISLHCCSARLWVICILDAIKIMLSDTKHEISPRSIYYISEFNILGIEDHKNDDDETGNGVEGTNEKYDYSEFEEEEEEEEEEEMEEEVEEADKEIMASTSRITRLNTDRIKNRHHMEKSRKILKESKTRGIFGDILLDNEQDLIYYRNFFDFEKLDIQKTRNPTKLFTIERTKEVKSFTSSILRVNQFDMNRIKSAQANIGADSDGIIDIRAQVARYNQEKLAAASFGAINEMLSEKIDESDIVNRFLYTQFANPNKIDTILKREHIQLFDQLDFMDVGNCSVKLRRKYIHFSYATNMMANHFTLVYSAFRIASCIVAGEPKSILTTKSNLSNSYTELFLQSDVFTLVNCLLVGRINQVMVPYLSKYFITKDKKEKNRRVINPFKPSTSFATSPSQDVAQDKDDKEDAGSDKDDALETDTNKNETGKAGNNVEKDALSLLNLSGNGMQNIVYGSTNVNHIFNPNFTYSQRIMLKTIFQRYGTLVVNPTTKEYSTLDSDSMENTIYKPTQGRYLHIIVKAPFVAKEKAAVQLCENSNFKNISSMLLPNTYFDETTSPMLTKNKYLKAINVSQTLINMVTPNAVPLMLPLFSPEYVISIVNSLIHNYEKVRMSLKDIEADPKKYDYKSLMKIRYTVPMDESGNSICNCIDRKELKNVVLSSVALNEKDYINIADYFVLKLFSKRFLLKDVDFLGIINKLLRDIQCNRFTRHVTVIYSNKQKRLETFKDIHAKSTSAMRSNGLYTSKFSEQIKVHEVAHVLYYKYSNERTDMHTIVDLMKFESKNLYMHHGNNIFTEFFLNNVVRYSKKLDPNIFMDTFTMLVIKNMQQAKNAAVLSQNISADHGEELRKQSDLPESTGDEDDLYTSSNTNSDDYSYEEDYSETQTVEEEEEEENKEVTEKKSGNGVSDSTEDEQMMEREEFEMNTKHTFNMIDKRQFIRKPMVRFVSILFSELKDIIGFSKNCGVDVLIDPGLVKDTLFSIVPKKIGSPEITMMPIEVERFLGCNLKDLPQYSTDWGIIDILRTALYKCCGFVPSRMVDNKMRYTKEAITTSYIHSKFEQETAADNIKDSSKVVIIISQDSLTPIVKHILNQFAAGCLENVFLPYDERGLVKTYCQHYSMYNVTPSFDVLYNRIFKNLFIYILGTNKNYSYENNLSQDIPRLLNDSQDHVLIDTIVQQDPSNEYVNSLDIYGSFQQEPECKTRSLMEMIQEDTRASMDNNRNTTCMKLYSAHVATKDELVQFIAEYMKMSPIAIHGLAPETLFDTITTKLQLEPIDITAKFVKRGIVNSSTYCKLGIRKYFAIYTQLFVNMLQKIELYSKTILVYLNLVTNNLAYIIKNGDLTTSNTSKDMSADGSKLSEKVSRKALGRGALNGRSGNGYNKENLTSILRYLSRLTDFTEKAYSSREALSAAISVIILSLINNRGAKITDSIVDSQSMEMFNFNKLCKLALEEIKHSWLKKADGEAGKRSTPKKCRSRSKSISDFIEPFNKIVKLYLIFDLIVNFNRHKETLVKLVSLNASVSQFSSSSTTVKSTTARASLTSRQLAATKPRTNENSELSDASKSEFSTQSSMDISATKGNTVVASPTPSIVASPILPSVQKANNTDFSKEIINTYDELTDTYYQQNHNNIMPLLLSSVFANSNSKQVNYSTITDTLIVDLLLEQGYIVITKDLPNLRLRYITQKEIPSLLQKLAGCIDNPEQLQHIVPPRAVLCLALDCSVCYTSQDLSIIRQLFKAKLFFPELNVIVVLQNNPDDRFDFRLVIDKIEFKEIRDMVVELSSVSKSANLCEPKDAVLSRLYFITTADLKRKASKKTVIEEPSYTTLVAKTKAKYEQLIKTMLYINELNGISELMSQAAFNIDTDDRGLFLITSRLPKVAHDNSKQSINIISPSNDNTQADVSALSSRKNESSDNGTNVAVPAFAVLKMNSDLYEISEGGNGAIIEEQESVAGSTSASSSFRSTTGSMSSVHSSLKRKRKSRKSVTSGISQDNDNLTKIPKINMHDKEETGQDGILENRVSTVISEYLTENNGQQTAEKFNSWINDLPKQRKGTDQQSNSLNQVRFIPLSMHIKEYGNFFEMLRTKIQRTEQSFSVSSLIEPGSQDITPIMKHINYYMNKLAGLFANDEKNKLFYRSVNRQLQFYTDILNFISYMIYSIKKYLTVVESTQYLYNTDGIRLCNVLTDSFILDRFIKSRCVFDSGMLDALRLENQQYYTRALAAGRDSIISILLGCIDKFYDSSLAEILSLVVIVYYDKFLGTIKHPKLILRTLMKIRSKQTDRGQNKFMYNGYHRRYGDEQFNTQLQDCLIDFSGSELVSTVEIMELYERAAVRLIRHVFFNFNEFDNDFSREGDGLGGDSTPTENLKQSGFQTLLEKNVALHSNKTDSLSGKNMAIIPEELSNTNNAGTNDNESTLEANEHNRTLNTMNIKSKQVNELPTEKQEREQEDTDISTRANGRIESSGVELDNSNEVSVKENGRKIDVDDEDEVMHYVHSPSFRRFRNIDLKGLCTYNPSKSTKTRYKPLLKFVLLECVANISMKLHHENSMYEHESKFLLDGGVLKMLFYTYIFTGTLNSKDIRAAIKIQTIKIGEFMKKNRNEFENCLNASDSIFSLKYGYIASEYKAMQRTSSTEIYRLLKCDISDRYRRKLTKMSQKIRVQKNRTNMKKDEMLPGMVFFENFRYSSIKKKIIDHNNIYSNNIFVFSDSGYDSMSEVFHLVTTELKLVKLPNIVYAKGLVEKFYREQANKLSCISCSLEGLPIKLKERPGMNSSQTGNSGGNGTSASGNNGGGSAVVTGGGRSVGRDRQYNIIILDGIESDEDISTLQKILLLKYNKKTEVNIIICSSFNRNYFNANEYSSFDTITTNNEEHKFIDDSDALSSPHSATNVGLKLLQMQFMDKSSILRLRRPCKFIDGLFLAIYKFTFYFNTSKFQTFIGARETRALLLAHALCLLNPNMVCHDAAFTQGYKALAIICNSICDNGDGTTTTSSFYNVPGSKTKKAFSKSPGLNGISGMDGGSLDNSKGSQGAGTKAMNIPGTYLLLNDSKSLYTNEMTLLQKTNLPQTVPKMCFEDVIQIILSYQTSTGVLRSLLNKCYAETAVITAPIQHLDELFVGTTTLEQNRRNYVGYSDVNGRESEEITKSASESDSRKQDVQTGVSASAITRSPISNRSKDIQLVELFMPSSKLQNILNSNVNEIRVDYMDPIEFYMNVNDKFNRAIDSDLALAELQPYSIVTPIRPHKSLCSYMKPFLGSKQRERKIQTTNVCLAHLNKTCAEHGLRVEDLPFSPYSLSYYTTTICYTYASLAKKQQKEDRYDKNLLDKDRSEDTTAQPLIVTEPGANEKENNSDNDNSMQDKNEKDKQDMTAALSPSSYILVLSTTETSLSIYKVRCRAIGAYTLKIKVKETIAPTDSQKDQETTASLTTAKTEEQPTPIEREKTYISFTDTPGSSEFYGYVSLMLKALDPTGDTGRETFNTETDYAIKIPVIGYPEISYFVSSNTDPFPKPLSFYENRQIRIEILE